MRKAFWYFRLAFAYGVLGWGWRSGAKDALYHYRWDNFQENREDGETPMEVVREELSCL